MSNAVLMPRAVAANETFGFKKGPFKGYAADRRLRDGTIERVERRGERLNVTIASLWGHRWTISFFGIVAVIARHPEGLTFTSLVEWGSESSERHFEFSNCIQPGDDWDPHLAMARLEVRAHGYDVTSEG